MPLNLDESEEEEEDEEEEWANKQAEFICSAHIQFFDVTDCYKNRIVPSPIT